MSGAYDHFKNNPADTHIKVTNSIEGDIGVMMNRNNDLFMRKFDGKIYRPYSVVALDFYSGFIKNLNDGSYVLRLSRASVSSRWVIDVYGDGSVHVLMHSSDDVADKLAEIQVHYPNACLANYLTKGTVKAQTLVLAGHKCLYDVNDEIYDYEPFNDVHGVFTKGTDLLPENTNYTKHSNDISLRGVVRSTAIANAGLAPDGSLTATKCVDTVDNNNHQVSSAFQYVAKDTHMVFSHYVEAGELPSCILDIFSDAAAVVQQRYYRVAFNLSDGTVMNTRSFGSPEDTTHGIDDLGNGWYRCWVGLKHYGLRDEDRIDCRVYMFNSTTISDGYMANPSYLGTGNDGLYVWGAQLEEGTKPSQVIVTGNGAATRLTDKPSLPAGTIQSGQRNITLAFKAVVNDANNTTYEYFLNEYSGGWNTIRAVSNRYLYMPNPDLAWCRSRRAEDTFPLDEPFTLIIVFRGSNQTLCAFVNGAKIELSDVADSSIKHFDYPLKDNDIFTGKLYCGCHYQGVDHQGHLQNTVIMQKALTDSQVLELHNHLMRIE